jgi:hypothetical protein
LPADSGVVPAGGTRYEAAARVAVTGENPLAQEVAWKEGPDPHFPYEAVVAGARWRLRINEWPDEPFLYTLFIRDDAIVDLEEWPDAWTRP